MINPKDDKEQVSPNSNKYINNDCNRIEPHGSITDTESWWESM